MWKAGIKSGICPSVKFLTCTITVFIKMGRGFKAPSAVPTATKRKRVHRHIYSTVLNGSIGWPRSGAMINKVHAWEGQILRSPVRVCRKKMGLPLLMEKIASKKWRTKTWAVYDGDYPIVLAIRSILEWRTTAWFEYDVGPLKCPKIEASIGFQRFTVGHTDGETAW